MNAPTHARAGDRRPADAGTRFAVAQGAGAEMSMLFYRLEPVRRCLGRRHGAPARVAPQAAGDFFQFDQIDHAPVLLKALRAVGDPQVFGVRRHELSIMVDCMNRQYKITIGMADLASPGGTMRTIRGLCDIRTT